MGDIVRKLLSNSFVLFVIFIVIAIIIPLPSWLLDFMILLNISLSLIILVMTMFIKEALEFSVFPTVLLLTTVLRLSLNVSTTRGILSSGYAGEVISAFGNFVMGGDAIVGFLIFIIIVLVNFIVITKGSERVSEVAARFTLDAMPGKQMAIDADLNAGIINEEQAKKRRSNIQREADFYGSMDGATKFVKGDAIMSIVTTLVNLIGGVIIGMVRGGGDFNTILNTYSLATVGDGLCSQIPALLISVATGMIVTRAASEDSLINDLKSQFTAQPFVLMIAGIVMVVMMVIPGFPTVVCLILGVLLILGAFLLNRNKKKMAELELAQRKKAEEKEMEKLPADNDYYRDIDNVFKLLNVEPIEMEFGYSLLRLVDEKSGGNFIERVVIFRKQFALDMGMVIPSVRMTDNPEINPNMYIIKIKGEEVARGEILVDHYLALDSGDVTQQIEGIDTVEPAFGLPAKWISEDKKIMADVAGYTLIDPVSVMITHWSEIMKRYAHELLSRQDVSTMLDNVKKTNPIGGRYYTESYICRIFAENTGESAQGRYPDTRSGNYPGNYRRSLQRAEGHRHHHGVRKAVAQAHDNPPLRGGKLPARDNPRYPDRGSYRKFRKEVGPGKLPRYAAGYDTAHSHRLQPGDRQDKGRYTDGHRPDVSGGAYLLQEAHRTVHSEHHGTF